VKTPAGVRLTSMPVKELQQLRTDTKAIKAQDIADKLDLSAMCQLNSPLLELELNLDVAKADDLVLRFSNGKGEYLDVGYSNKDNQLFIDRTKAGKTDFNPKFNARHGAVLPLDKGQLKLHLFLDVASVEVFANDGLGVMTDIFFPTEHFTKVELLSPGARMLEGSNAYVLKSIW
jgi:fructan beta-fructosidase